MFTAGNKRPGTTKRQVRALETRIRRRVGDRRGFTLIEAGMTTVIIAVAVLAVMASFGAYHQKNQWAARVATATWLANEVREATHALPRRDPVTGDDFWGPEINELDPTTFDDGDDFDGDGNGCILTADQASDYDWTALGYTEVWTQGPRNARLEPIPDMDGWTQLIEVKSVDPFNIAFDPDDPSTYVIDGTSDVMAIVVTVLYRGPKDTEPETMTQVSWIMPN